MPIAPEYLHLVHPGPFPALLYGRNSRDPKKKGRSVNDQLTTGRTLCATHGWPIADEFKDTGISASRHAKKKRDDFEELLAAIEERKGRIVVAFEASRYYRDLEAYVRLRNACYKANVLLCYNGMVYDLSRREDRKATAQDALAAEDEVEGIRDRNLRTVRLTAEAGGPHGRLSFGYTRRYDPETGDLMEQYPHPVQSPFVREAFERFDSGQTVYTIIKWLNSEAAAARPDGSRWARGNVRYLLLNPAYIAERVHQGKVIGAAMWKPILTGPQGQALFYRVHRKLTDPARRTHRDSKVVHKLSCLALCGQCGDRVTLRSVKSGRGRLEYRCTTGFDTTIGEAELDAYVEEAVLAWLSTSAARVALIPDGSKAAAESAAAEGLIARLTEQLEEARRLSTQFTEDGLPLLSLASLGAQERELQPRIDAARSLLQAATGVPHVVQELLDAADPEGVWAALTLEQQRAVIRLVVTVRVWKAARKGIRRIEPGRVTLSFAGQPGYLAGSVSARGLAALQGEQAAEPGSQ